MMWIDIEECKNIESLRAEAHKMEAVIQSLLESNVETRIKKVNRLEVIDEDGRSYSKWGIKHIELSFQDCGNTLKLFVSESDQPLF